MKTVLPAPEPRGKFTQLINEDDCPDYEARPTNLNDAVAHRDIEKCQEAFVESHFEMYKGEYPNLTRSDWWTSLSCGRIRNYLHHKVIIIRAVHRKSKKVAGYISCSLVNDPDRLAKVNHLIVLSDHRNRGVGTMLMASLEHYIDGDQAYTETATDLQIVALERNLVALEWYWRMNFVTMEVYSKNFHEHLPGRHRIGYCKLIRSKRESLRPKKLFFQEEVCDEKVELPHGFAVSGPERKRLRRKTKLPPQWVKHEVKSFDRGTGLHVLETGRNVDLTELFSWGLLRFSRPLHTILPLTPRKRKSSGSLSFGCRLAGQSAVAPNGHTNGATNGSSHGAVQGGGSGADHSGTNGAGGTNGHGHQSNGSQVHSQGKDHFGGKLVQSVRQHLQNLPRAKRIFGRSPPPDHLTSPLESAKRLKVEEDGKADAT